VAEQGGVQQGNGGQHIGLAGARRSQDHQQLAVERAPHRQQLRLVCREHLFDRLDQVRLCLTIGTVEHAEELQAELGRGALAEKGFFQLAQEKGTIHHQLRGGPASSLSAAASP
jgi:hypothetical protein